MGSITFYVDGMPVTVDDRTYSFNEQVEKVSDAAFKSKGWTQSRHETWRTQPAIRMVTGFLATNVAQVPIHAFKRDGKDRERLDHTDPVATLFRSPDQRRRQTGFDWMNTLVLDVCINDRYCAQVFMDDRGNNQLVRIPPSRFTFERDSMDAPKYIKVTKSDNTTFQIPLEKALWLDGFPSDTDTSPMASLEGLLAEDQEAADYRRQLWINGGRMPGWISRPLDAPEWTVPKTPGGESGRDRFRTSWQAYAAGGIRAGRTPLLEEGMAYHELTGITPESGQQLESRKFSLGLVAAAYHMSPQVAAVLEGGSYNSVEAYREALYSDTLGSWFQRIQQAINVRLLPQITNDPDVFVEFNVAEKLRMNFEATSKILQTSTGAPIMTRNEARQRINLPAIEGADELIVPLNVLEGGQASPTDSGTQNEN